MKTTILFLTTFLLIFVTACKKEGNSTFPNQDNSDVLTIRDKPFSVPAGQPMNELLLNKTVIKTLEYTGHFDWNEQTLDLFWSALQYNDHSLAIGYGSDYRHDISKEIHTINIQAAPYKNIHDQLLTFILDEVNKRSEKKVSISDILIEDDPILPIITIRLTDKYVLTALKNLNQVRYLEPLDYWPGNDNRSGSGCSASTSGINSFDYNLSSNGAKIPWNYNLVNIPQAWTASQGAGITVGLIDAGISSGQSLLGSGFNDGLSNIGRTVTTAYTKGTSAFTTCTHGTSMSGLAVGPMNSQNATTGVAYKSNLYFVRACDDVVLDASAEKTGVKNALTLLGNNVAVKVISMSIGNPFSSSVLKDGVDFAYGKGKLIFAAAGTSFSWTTWYGVIYPAAYSSCVAVTGVTEAGNKCSNCHDGSKVLYTIPMERNADSNRNSLSLAANGSTPTYIGGSSCATATTAGIAALVWSAKPSLTRDQVITCLTNTAQFYPTKSSSKGYGNLNAQAAINYALTNY